MNKPVVMSYCSTFLKPEMLHVYRQIIGIKTFENWVVTRRRQCAEQFPYDRLVVLEKSPWRILRRSAYRLCNRPVPLGAGEVRQLVELAEARSAQVIHVYFGTEAARALAYLRAEKRAKVVSFHGADLSASMADRDFTALLNCVDLFLARSGSLAQALIERGCPADRIRLSRTGIPVPAESAIGPPGPQRGHRLLQACRFIEKKGVDLTIRCVGQLVERGYDVTLDLAGDGPDRNMLINLTRELGLEDRVKFLGFLPNSMLLSRLSQYSLFVHPSRDTDTGDREGIPNAMLEAMAYRLPVVATGHGGIPEAVTDGVEGRLVAQGDPRAIADAIADILSNPDKQLAMAGAARARVEIDFSSDRAIEQLCSAYNDAIRIAASRNAARISA